MIDLTRIAAACSLVHTAPSDPGISWTSHSVVIDASPDDVPTPSSGGQPAITAPRTGICGAVAPRVLALPNGGYRMYYTQLLPRAGYPEGANDYDNATSRILSATSPDGRSWMPEPGIRLSAADGGAGDFRVVSSEVVPCGDRSGGLRMYFECCAGPQSMQNSIRSAVSDDGLQWTVEPDARLEFSGQNLTSPRILFLPDGRCRLFCCQRGTGIISAVSDDGGRTFVREPGVRILPNGQFDGLTAFAPDILRLPAGGYRMYYAGYGSARRADILTAVSNDGLTWQKAHSPVISPGANSWDAAKCSEMCVIWKPDHPDGTKHLRMLYEACDGTAKNHRGVWRIAAAVGNGSES
ncbi:MAG: hypothetical protein GY758_33045 [Fuerstiella sp.]|jgi:hypothetical protein|nr:hypothetical protein [Fuerstiella sp.]MCP4507157.1 hypothetical protein [Fuerstiella sp.]MDG2130641.1 hypothetical protein [Fuerstiella sp.]